MEIALQCFLYAILGFLQEVFIVVYHRATSSNRKILASIMTMLITTMSLMVVAHITHQILSFGGMASLFYVIIFACGKGIGAYTTLTWWAKFLK